MSGVRGRLARVQRGGSEIPAVEQLTRRFGELEEWTRSELERQEALVRGLATDLTERLAAIERRLAALEARDQ